MGLSQGDYEALGLSTSNSPSRRVVTERRSVTHVRPPAAAVAPGAILGILGSGQLGRMLALAAAALGYRVQVYSPETGSPAGQVAEREVIGAYDDVAAVAAFAAGVDLLTFEFENVSSAAVTAAAERTVVRPGARVLATTQHRAAEKRFLSEAGFPVAAWAPLGGRATPSDAGPDPAGLLAPGGGAVRSPVAIASVPGDSAAQPGAARVAAPAGAAAGTPAGTRADTLASTPAGAPAGTPAGTRADTLVGMPAGVTSARGSGSIAAAGGAARPGRVAADRVGRAAIGYPAIVKTAGFGYDGKGQRRVENDTELAAAIAAASGAPLILERVVPFDRELSVIGARSASGEYRDFGPFENCHDQRHILDVSHAPAACSAPVQRRARELVHAVMEQLEVVGLLCVELFQVGQELIVNELAPRPHNSGHLTLDACLTSQFEQHVRAVCGLPLGDPRQHTPAAMANLLGDLWPAGTEPPWPRLLAAGDVKLHLYGKREPRAGRKMGHLTALAATPAAAVRRVSAARALLAAAS